MLVFNMLESIVRNIDSTCRKFLWANDGDKKKFSLVAWKKLCREKSKGGIGLRKMEHLNLSHRDKMEWNLSL